MKGVVLNLFDQRTVVNRVSTVRHSGVIPTAAAYYQEAAFAGGQHDFEQLISKAVTANLMTLNSQFRMANAYQAPIVARFGVKFTF